jgi:hypothetical protein
MALPGHRGERTLQNSYSQPAYWAEPWEHDRGECR